MLFNNIETDRVALLKYKPAILLLLADRIVFVNVHGY